MEYLSIDGQISQDLILDNNVTLPYDNTGVDFSFTALQYGENPTTYQYQMEGFDPAWNTLQGTSHAYYSHLPVGKFTLKVRLANTDTPNAIKTVKVTVTPPWWLTPIMKWLIYPLSFLIFIAAIAYLYYRRTLNKRQLQEALRGKLQEQRANELNMRFFSNISHEFRTPLTLINGALSMIEDDTHDRLHNIMRNNTQRMMRMVNQLMDFNKLENGMLKLAVNNTDARQLISGIADMFEATLSNRNKPCNLILPEQPVNAFIDTDKFEKIMVNLISNAIKYSGDNTPITIQMTLNDNLMTVNVEDNGTGVPEDKREEIFLRFYQLKQTGKLPSIGTGIGLYYTKNLVQLHHGNIQCLPNNPQGAIFQFTIPINQSAYNPDELATTSPVGATLAVASESGRTQPVRQNTSTCRDEACPHPTTAALVPAVFTSVVVPPPVGADRVSARPVGAPLACARDNFQLSTFNFQHSTIMLVDDDPDVINFLQLILAPHYNTHTYLNPQTAYQDIENIKPELIISDVMMYELDGYQFCQMIKDNNTICHIPVILLTAKTELEEQIHGLDCGASAYITKPFSPQYLLSMLKSQLDNLHRIRHALNTNTKIQPAEEKTLQQADKKFMDQFYKYIESHLSDPELQMEELTTLLGMSRSKLFYKTKALTGDTPNAFFKTYKLNRASEMILEGKEKLAYIAYITGFSSPSHFSANFKKHFGCSPSEYKGGGA